MLVVLQLPQLCPVLVFQHVQLSSECFVIYEVTLGPSILTKHAPLLSFELLQSSISGLIS